MPGTSAAHTIWFIAAVMVAAVLAGAVVGISYSLSNGLNTKGNQLEGQLSTKIKIINDPKRVPYDAANSTLTFYVYNMGYTVLNKNTSAVLVLINGVASGQPSDIKMYSGAANWKNGEVAVISMYAAGLLPDTDYSVWITASDIGSGATAQASMEFNITFV